MAQAPGGMNRFYTLLIVIGFGGLGGPRVSGPAAADRHLDSGDGGHSARRHGRVSRLPDGQRLRAGRDHRICRFPVPRLPELRSGAVSGRPEAADRTGKLRWRYRDFPLEAHPHSRVAAHAAACASEQGHFWEMFDRIYQGQMDWSERASVAGTFRGYARDSRAGPEQVRRLHEVRPLRGPHPGQLRGGDARGVGATPSFLIGNRLYRGRAEFRRPDPTWSTPSSRPPLPPRPRSDRTAARRTIVSTDMSTGDGSLPGHDLTGRANLPGALVWP